MFKLKKIIFLLTLCFIFESKSQCIQDDALEASPPPMSDPFTGGNPTYFPGQVIEFCYTIESYDGADPDNNNNWMHGIVPLFGPGWDLSSLIPVGQPESVNDTDGEWIWIDNVVGSNTGNLVSEPGWWFDASSGGGGLNGDPGDNYGDGGAGSWTFCWQITVKECPPGENGDNLVMEVTNYSDGEMGSYTQEGCEDDPSLFFYANLNCPTCDETELTVVQPTCAEPEGLAYVVPDGEGPWNLTWLDPFGNIAAINTNITGPFSFTGLLPNDYYVIVEDTFDECLFTIPFTVEEPEDPLVDLQVYSISCFGEADGSIDVTQIGQGSYEYLWTFPSGSSVTDEDLFNLPAGDYLLEIINTDNFCEYSEIVNVPQPSVLSVLSSVSDYSGYGVSCNGACDGYIGVDVIGGTGFEVDPEPDDDCVFYDWVADLDGDGIDDFFASNANISNLCAGTYNLIATDCNNCITATTFIITEPENEISISEVHSDYSGYGVSCSGGSDGFIDITVLGGTGIYTYEWSNGFENEDLSNIPAGIYSVTVFDNNNCSQTIEVEITEPDAVVISSSNISTISCPGGNDGSITIDISGGFSPYDINWSSINGFNSNSEDIDGLLEGEYQLTVTDSLNCAYDFSFNVPEEPGIDVVETHEDVSCFGENDGSIDVVVSGGVPPFVFQWSNGEMVPNIDGLGPGNYNLTITDSNFCVENIEVLIQEPDELVFSVNTFDVLLCFGDPTGSAYLTINGGTPPYNQNWFGFNPNALQGGDYLVSVTDANGCVYEEEFVINQPEELELNIETSDVFDCYGSSSGTAELFINGGVPPYLIDTGNLVNLDQIPAGTYVFSVLDDNGCEVSETFSINQPDLIQVDLQIINALCPNDNSGQAIANINGGTPPYNQVWSDLLGNPVNPNTLFAGEYQLTVSDQFDCYLTQNFTVYETQEEPIYILMLGDPVCLNEFSVNAIGGIGDGSWSYTGDGNIVFGDSNNSLTTVNCSDYGSYELFYTDECGVVQSFLFNMIPDPVQIADIGSVYCSFSTTLALEEISTGDGFWSVTPPNGEDAVFDDPNATNPVLTVSDYGTYTVFYSSCGYEDEIEIEFVSAPLASFFITYDECELVSEIFVNVEEGVENGYFEFVGGPGNIIINNETPNSLEFEIEEGAWGFYTFNYHVCDTFATVQVGFSCPIIIPNTFSPNGDGWLDEFFIQGLDFEIHKDILFTVYNRYGYIVFSGTGYDPVSKVLWDGRVLGTDQFVSDGVYYYILELYNNTSQSKESYQGNMYISTKITN